MTSKTNVTSGFLVAGLEHCGMNNVIESWGQGFLELIIEVVSYADYITAVKEAANEIYDDFPGLFEYEVTESVGSAIGRLIIETGATPPEAYVYNTIHLLVHEFFERSNEKENITLLTLAISKLPLNREF